MGPVLGHLGKVEALADVDQIEDILLEAGAPEADAGLEELGADSGVSPDGLGDLRHVGPRGLAHRRHGVDAGDSLGKEGVSGQLGELGGPGVHGDDAVCRHPVLVHVGESRDGLAPLLGLLPADEDTIRLQKIVDSGALGQELRVGEDLVGDPGLDVVPEDVGDALRRLDGDRALLHHDLAALALGHRVGNHPRRQLHELEVSGLALAHPERLGRRVHTDKYQLKTKCKYFLSRSKQFYSHPRP